MFAIVRSSMLALVLVAPFAMGADNAAQSSGSKAIHDAMMKHMSAMQNMKMSGDPDKDFAMMMIHHHEQAIDMARAELKHGKSAETRKKAQEIIAESEKGIADLKKQHGTEHGKDHGDQR